MNPYSRHRSNGFLFRLKSQKWFIIIRQNKMSPINIPIKFFGCIYFDESFFLSLRMLSLGFWKSLKGSFVASGITSDKTAPRLYGDTSQANWSGLLESESTSMSNSWIMHLDFSNAGLWSYSHSLREKCPKFSPNTGKYRPEITPYLDTFHTVTPIWHLSWEVLEVASRFLRSL